MSGDIRSAVLDTHIWLWLASGSAKAVSPKLRALAEKLGPAGGIRISAISVWEIGLLASKGRISFNCSTREWIHRSLTASQVTVQDVTTDIAIESTLLEDCHADPADRILIATAKQLGATLLTHDKEILSYTKKHGLDARSL